jgi:hypothetical protein
MTHTDHTTRHSPYPRCSCGATRVMTDRVLWVWARGVGRSLCFYCLGLGWGVCPRPFSTTQRLPRSIYRDHKPRRNSRKLLRMWRRWRGFGWPGGPTRRPCRRAIVAVRWASLVVTSDGSDSTRRMTAGDHTSTQFAPVGPIGGLSLGRCEECSPALVWPSLFCFFSFYSILNSFLNIQIPVFECQIWIVGPS